MPWTGGHGQAGGDVRRGRMIVAALVAAAMSTTGVPAFAETADINAVPVVPASATGPAAAAFSDTPASSGTTSAMKPHSGNYDPLEDVNRYFFSLDMALDDALFKPTAYAYRYIVPKPGRKGIRNALNNLESPVIFANDVLQGEIGRAGNTTARFLINSTLGIAGLFDVAKSMGIPRHTEDFGQTLAVGGAGGGPYLVLPIFGPTNFRDLTGKLVDIVFDPMTWMGGSNAEAIAIGRYVLDAISEREANIEAFDEIERTSIDLYAQVRSIYYQHRQSQIKNGRDDLNDLPDLSGLE
ncbi:MAG: VacJ family lipoprotein [Alphaproteobacteria bacterium]